MPVVSVQPDGQLLSPSGGAWIGLGVGPVAERGLDEALGFAIGLGRIWPGADVLEPQFSTGTTEGFGAIARAVVGHHPRNGYAQAEVIGDGGPEEGHGALLLLVGQNLREADARGIVDRDVDELPADRSRAAGLAVAGDAVTDLVETAELLEVDVDQLARMLALIAADRFGRLERRNAIEAKAPENPADGRRRHPELGGDLLAGPALPAQRLDPFDHRHCGGPMQAMRPRGAILQSLNAFSLKPGN